MKKPTPLTARFIETVREPGRYGDGRGSFGLTLNVHKSKSGRITKSWIQRLPVGGRITHLGLGQFPIISLAEARKLAFENKRAVAHGNDPRTSVPTFAEAVEKVIENYAAGWTDGGKSEAQWRASLRDYAMDRIGQKRVNEIKTAELMAILLPHWQHKNETMRRVWQRIGAVMKWSIAQGYRKDNPAGESLRAALPKNSIRRGHLKALPHTEVGAAIAKIRASQAFWSAKACFEFMTLTITRSGEARLAAWDEIDLETISWTIPAERMKAKRAHRVPLSDQVFEILLDARERTGGAGLIFPAKTGKAMSDSTISKLVRENGIGCVPHGMRSSARDWMAELSDAPHEVCELALAHVNTNRVEAAYRRSDLFERRKALMQEWANYVTAGNVVPLRARA